MMRYRRILFPDEQKREHELASKIAEKFRRRYLRQQGGTMILFWDPTGPKLTYDDGVLHVSDLNPQVETHWRMTRWDMLKLGVGCIAAALIKSGASVPPPPLRRMGQ